MKSQPFNAAYDGRPQDYDALRACWLNERRLKFLIEKLRAEPAPQTRRVIELGSGTGWLLLALAAIFPEISFCGLEAQPDYVDFSLSKSTLPNLTFIAATVESIARLSLPPADIILSNDVLHHIDNIDAAVAAVSQAAAPGCRWHLIEPNYLNLYSFYRQSTTPGERVFWPREFSTAATRHHWQQCGSEHLFLIPPFVRTPPSWLKKAESLFESIPFAAGGLYQNYVFKP